METINDRVQKLIKHLGITKTSFAEKINVSPAFVSMLCSGKTALSDRTIMDICREFGVSEQWLREGVGEMFPPRTRVQELADFAADLMRDEPDSFRALVVSFLAKWDVSDWEAVANILKKHGGFHYPPNTEETGANT